MKKILAMLSIFVLVLAGCSGTKDEASNEEKNLSGEIKVAVEGEKLVNYYTDMAKAFMEENPGVTVTVEEAEMFKLLDALPTQKGNTADVFMLPNDRIGDLAEQKLITNVDADLSGYTDTAQTAANYNEKNYMVPMATDTTLLFYNKDVYPDGVTSLDSLNKEDWLGHFTDFYYTAGFLIGEGGYIFGDEVTDIGLNNEGSVQAGKYIQDLYQTGGDNWEIMKDAEAGAAYFTQAFKEGKVNAIIAGPWEISGFEEAGVNYGVMPIPGYTSTSKYSPLVGTKGLTINGYSENKELAQSYLAFLATGENATKFYEAAQEVSPHTEVKYEDGSTFSIILDATTKGTSMPTDGDFGKVWEPMKSALIQIANGQDVQASLDAAVESITADVTK